MFKKNFFYLFLLPVAVLAQSKTISGKVLDVGNQPLAGASIVVKDQNIGTTTDFDGVFNLSVPETAQTLVVSYLGYITQELPIGTQTIFAVQLKEDVSALDEVVVVGYGTQRRGDVSTAISSVRLDESVTAVTNTVDQLLQGRAAGVQVTQNSGAPGSGVTVKIRGANSLRGNNEPLYVIDGVILSSAGEDARNPSADTGSTLTEAQNGLNGINPRDIESIEVLKDASATAIYGSRGANGVILITTKKGKEGKVAINTYVNTTMVQIDETLNMLDGISYARYQNEALLAAGNPARYQINGSDVYFINNDGTVDTTPLEQHNWQDEIYKSGFSKAAGASFSGGTSDSNFYSSLAYNDIKGTIENQGLQSGNFNFNYTKDLSDKLSLNVRFNAFYLKGSNAQDGDRTGFQRSFIGNLIYYPSLVTEASGIPGNDEGFSNPNSWINDFEDTSEESRFRASLQLNYKFNVKGLEYKLQAGGDLRNKERRRFYGVTTWQGSFANGSLGISDLNVKTYQINNLLSYNRNFNKHRINAVAGFTYDVRDSNNSIYEVENFSTTQFGVENPAYGQRISNPLQNFPDKSQLVSYLARVNYAYRNRYVLTGSVRADGSSKFADGNKFSYFPSFSFAWRANNEKFLKKSELINELKFRVGWGATGNQGIQAYQTTANYGPVFYANPQEGTNNGFVPLNLPNPDLLWETTKQLNIGLDFGLWDDRFNGTIDVYNKSTDGLLINQITPPSTGFRTITVNEGSIGNKGVEFSLNGKLIQKKDISFSVGGNIAFNKTEITNLGIPESSLFINGEDQLRSFYFGGNISSGGFFKSPANIFLEGEEVGLFYGYKTDGIYQTAENITVFGFAPQPGDVKFVDQNNDGIIDENDRTIIGNPNPDFVYGGYLDFKYKRLSLNVQMNGVYGNDIMNGTKIALNSATGNYVNLLTEAYNNAWRPEAPSNTHPRVGWDGDSNANAPNDRIVEDGSFLRINNITLGYDIPVDQFNAISRANIYVTGLNLFTFTKYSGYNPEITSFLYNPTITGVDWNGFPNVKSFVLGLNLNF